LRYPLEVSCSPQLERCWHEADFSMPSINFSALQINWN
jgi:hypothetical protein